MNELTTVDENRTGFIFNGKEYVLDGYLKSNLNYIGKRTINKWDNLIIIDGPERSGKTTLGVTSGAYLSTILKRPFSVDSVFFDIDSLTDFARTTTNQIILWDEAALGGIAQQWASSEQMKLKQLLITCGKYNHILIFIIPDFTILGKYFAVHRSSALLRVFTDDGLTRGRFKAYDQMGKRLLYDQEKKGIYYGHGIKPAFKSRFSNNEGILDLEAYEKKKDEAIQMIGQEKEKPDSKDFRKKLYILIDDMHQNWRVPYKYIKDLIGFDENLITKSIQYYRKKGDIGDFEYKLGKKVKQFQMPDQEAKV